MRNEWLKGGSLKGADVSFSDMRNLDLAGTDLTGANFLGANIAGSDLSKAIGLTQGQVEVMVCVYDSSDRDAVRQQLMAISDRDSLGLDIDGILNSLPYLDKEWMN